MTQFYSISPILSVALSFGGALLPAPFSFVCSLLGFMLSIVIAWNQDTLQSWVDVVLAAQGFIPEAGVPLAIIAWLEWQAGVDIPKME